MKVDALVVGGGMAGASVAYWLARRCRVLLVEREDGFGYHSTGRSAAEWAAAGFGGVLRALLDYGRPFFDAPPAGFAAGPLLEARGALEFDPPGATPAGPPAGLTEITPAQALAIVPFLRPEVLGRCYHDPGVCEIDVHALHTGFLRGVRTAGGVTLHGVEFHGARRHGDLWRARIGDGECDVGLIVDAAGAWTDVVAQRCGVAPLGLEPRRRTALSFDPGFDARRVPPVEERASGFYFKGLGAALMVCAGDATPVAPCDAQPEEIDIAAAVDHFERCTHLRIGRLASRWAGLRSFVADQQPVAGFATDAAGFFFVAGQGGAGIMSAPGLGAVAAALALGEGPPPGAAALGITAQALSPARLPARA
jgi:D-arginine dehydrogenase